MSDALLNSVPKQTAGTVSVLVRVMYHGKVPLQGHHHLHDLLLGGLTNGTIVDI